MPVLIRFKINVPSISGPSYEDVASAIAQRGRGNGDEAPTFVVFGAPQYPDSTVVECLRTEHFVNALQTVQTAIEAAGVGQFCTGGDLHIRLKPF